MKNIKKLILIAFAVGCTIANIFAMEDREKKGLPKPDLTWMTEPTQEEAPSATATTATTQTPSAAEIQAFNETHDLDFLSALPDLVLENFLARDIESYLANVSGQMELLGKLKLAINRLKNLRLINKRFAKFLTYQEIIFILIEANIVSRANRINPDSGETLLHRAIRTRNIALSRILIRTDGVNINAPLAYPRNPKILKKFHAGSTPLHIAAERGYAEIVRLLLQHGADITAVTTSSNQELNEATPLDFARMNRCDEVIAIIEAAYRERGIAIPEIRRILQHGAMQAEEMFTLHAAPAAMDPEAEEDGNFSLSVVYPDSDPARHLDFLDDDDLFQ